MIESTEIWHFEKVTNRKYDVVDNSGEQVCRMVLKRPEGVNSKTNCSDKITGEYRARLIAAAPDLLEALDALVKINEDHNNSIQGVIGTPPGWNDSYLDAARKALEKARGQQ